MTTTDGRPVVGVTRDTDDTAWIVQIDTDTSTGPLIVNVNDAAVACGDPVLIDLNRTGEHS